MHLVRRHAITDELCAADSASAIHLIAGSTGRASGTHQYTTDRTPVAFDCEIWGQESTPMNSHRNPGPHPLYIAEGSAVCETKIPLCILHAVENEFGERSGVSPPVLWLCTGKLTHAARQFSDT